IIISVESFSFPSSTWECIDKSIITIKLKLHNKLQYEFPSEAWELEKHWDSVELPNISIDDLDMISFEKFIQKAIRYKRMDEAEKPKDYTELLDKLRLIENGFIKRAGALLFAKDPQRYVTGAYVKIAFFEDSADIVYQDVIEGNILEQIEKTFDLLFTKYLKALISYDGLQRIEQFDYNINALREIITNAIVHKDYSSGVPIQIGIFKEKLFIFNTGQLPQNWTIDTITSPHRSIPFNPDIANAFFKAGYIESWGRDIEKVIKASKDYNGITPSFKWDNGLNVEFKSKYPNEVESSVKTRVKILELLNKNSNITNQELADILNLTLKGVEWQIKQL
ncbi:MAG: winged helix-turn-helix transcriptional regulator, partial [Arcobacteraceae bacterium]|nr:winged helix-turn-helix transcriptional regulator [Arcobacteraceae bacterium]